MADSSRDYMDLFELAKIAHEVAGEHHRFRFIQLPFNLAMPEAYGLVNQRAGKEKMSLLSAASRLGIAVMGSATLYQARLTQGLPDFVGKYSGHEDRCGQRDSVLALRARPHNFSNRNGPQRARSRESETRPDQPNPAAGMEEAVHQNQERTSSMIGRASLKRPDV